MFKSNPLSAYLPKVITLTNFRLPSLTRGCYWEGVMHKIVKAISNALGIALTRFVFLQAIKRLSGKKKEPLLDLFKIQNSP